MVRLQRNDPLEIGGKRSRPVSSLDFKADRSDPQLVVTDSATSGGRTSREESAAPKSEWKRNDKRNNLTPLTRSRGSSGIPQQPRTLADLEGMTQEEMSEALSNDPALAEELKQATEQYQQQQRQQQREAGHTRRGSGSSSTGSSKSSSFVKGGDRVTILKENGVPYQQWGILLLCLGVGLYQVYKAMKPPGSKKGKKTKSGDLKSQIDDAVIAELEGSVAKTSHAAAKKAKKKKPTKATKAPSESTVAHSTPVPRAKQAPEPQAEILFEDELVEEGEWKTVGNGPAPKPKTEAPTAASTTVVSDDAITVHTSNTTKKKKKNGASATATKAQELVNNKVESVPEVATPAPEAAMNGSSSSTPAHEEALSLSPHEDSVVPDEAIVVKKKKIKKKKIKEEVIESAKTNGASHAAADAALAQQLQQEEDQMVREQAAAVEAAIYESNGTETTEQVVEDEWAEVIKKKKPIKAPVAVESDTAAAAEPTAESSAGKETVDVANGDDEDE